MLLGHLLKVNNILALGTLTNLEGLDFGKNEVTDILPLVANAGLGAGDYINMINNYLDLTPGSENMKDIETLIERGVDVEYEPQRM